MAKVLAIFPKNGLMNVRFESNISEGLAALEREVREHVLRSSAYAGADVLYKEMRLRVPIKTGKLYESIYHWFDTKQSTDWRKIYTIGPNKRKAPHWYNVEYGHWRYNRSANGRWLRSKSNKNARVAAPGTMDFSAHDIATGRLSEPQWVVARPYIRATFDAAGGAAVNAAKARMSQKMKEAIATIGARAL